MRQSAGMMMMCMGLLLCVVGAQARVLKGVTGTVTVSAPPGSQTVIETTETRGGQTVLTGRQMVSGSTTVVLNGGNAQTVRSASVSATTRPAKVIRRTSGSMGITVVAKGDGGTARSTAAVSTGTPTPTPAPTPAPAPAPAPAPVAAPAQIPAAASQPAATVSTGPILAQTVGSATRQVLPAQDRVVERQATALGQSTRVDPQGQTVAQSFSAPLGLPAQSGVAVSGSDTSG